jgi:hypothetical protein
LINKFGHFGGFISSLKRRFGNNLNGRLMKQATLMFGNCWDYLLTSNTIQTYFDRSVGGIRIT